MKEIFNFLTYNINSEILYDKVKFERLYFYNQNKHFHVKINR